MKKKYTRANEEQAIIKMFQGLSDSGKSKIARARSFPTSIVDNFDLFKTYFLSGEGLPKLMAQLTQKEIMLLNILHFNEWISDVSVFEAAYIEMPKAKKYYRGGYGSFTQKYGSVLKKVKTNLVQKGVLVQYEQSGVKTIAEKQRFMFPASFASYLPSPFIETTTLQGIGTHSDEKMRKVLLEAVQIKSAKTKDTISIQNRKLHIGNNLLTTQAVEKLQLYHWGASFGSMILRDGFGLEGKKFSSFVLHYLKQLPKDQWFSPTSITPLLAMWNDPIQRKQLDSSQKYPSRYEPSHWCEAGWQVGILQKKETKGKAFYRLAEEIVATTTDYSNYLTVKDQAALTIDVKKVPFSDLAIFAQLAVFSPTQSHMVEVAPDLVHISSVPAAIWEHPLTKWLEKNAPTFTKAFAHYRKNYGKEIVHEELLVAKITDLSLRVLVEKGLLKKYSVQVLSDEFIAFPKAALSVVEKLVAKSGNVIKRKKV